MKLTMIFAKEHPIPRPDGSVRMLRPGDAPDDIPDDVAKGWIKSGEAEPALRQAAPNGDDDEAGNKHSGNKGGKGK